MTGPKLNEYPVKRPGAKRLKVTAEQPLSVRALARYVRVSPTKVRQVLDLIRGQDVQRAREILRFCDRDAAEVVGKVLDSAVANADANHELHDSEELYVSACYADEGPTLKRWRPRARGRATRIRKRTCHVTVLVTRLPENDLARRRTRTQAAQADRRRRRAGQQAAAERSATQQRREDAGTPEEVEGAIVDEPTEEPVEETTAAATLEVTDEPVETVDTVDTPEAEVAAQSEALADEAAPALPADDEPKTKEEGE
ncbi:MAG: ribosomal protein bacterial type [Acidimicrobiales bacterium]|nr:ribosomal protein bacterial type [Acidimicrobiales bacterium]